MAFRYLSDLFGKFRRRTTKFTDVEKRAKQAIYNYVHRKISSGEMFNEMMEIRNEYYRLLNEDGQITVGEDTPLWMNQFFGYKFKKWSDFQLLKKHFAEHPEELVGKMEADYRKICNMGYDSDFMTACKEILKELR